MIKKGMEKMLMVTQTENTAVFLTSSLIVRVSLNLVKELQFFFT